MHFIALIILIVVLFISDNSGGNIGLLGGLILFPVLMLFCPYLLVVIIPIAIICFIYSVFSKRV